MFRMIEEPTIIALTPQKANKCLLLNTFQAQRPLRPGLINLLANEMREGTFHGGEIAIAILNYNGGERVLVNGQHTCESVIMTNTTQKAQKKVFECDSPEGLAELYGKFDTYGNRTLSDLVTVEAWSAGIDWPKRICNLVVSAAAIKEGKQQVHKAKKARLLKQYIPEGKFINYILNESLPKGMNKRQETSHLTRSPVVYAMMLTYGKHQGMAKQFWVDVRDGEDLKRSMPAYRIRDFLKLSTFDRGRGASGNNLQTVSMHEMTSRCITAWNNFRKGKSISIIKYFPSKSIPKAI